MQQPITKNTPLKLTIRDMVSIVVVIGSFFTMYFTLKAEIDEAKILPKPEVTQEQIDHQKELINSTITVTQKDIERVKQDLTEIKEMLKLMEQRQYDSKTWPKSQK